MASDRIAFVQSRWHSDLVDKCRDGFRDEFADLRPDVEVELFEVPGALEIPLRAKLLAETGQYRAIVAAGLVVDGGIYRHEFVAHAVIDGLVRVGLETRVPVLSAVLTPHHFHEHDDHIGFFAQHLAKKGAEAARSCSDVLEWSRS
ncbi:6,7-dimethyl-8-ribityllumazine synthase [soil metagenome]